ncbi:MAG TPA: hypothetical protein DHV68_05385 [Dehalococcoidia bacterium]|nr:hypothetical protein [Chloroflexota bacterium]HCI86258.1 hypothetical protein [Dehalococcoidia bacterium]
MFLPVASFQVAEIYAFSVLKNTNRSTELSDPSLRERAGMWVARLFRQVRKRGPTRLLTPHLQGREETLCAFG